MKHLFTRSFIIMLTLLCCSVVSAKQLYVIGDDVFGGWNPDNPIPMTLDEDGVTNTITVTTSKIEKPIYWTICDGADSDWVTFNTTYRYGVQPDNYDVEIGEYQLVKCNGTFKMDAGEYTITVNSETMQMTISGEPYPTGEKHYTVAGSPENVFGTEWDPANTANEMQKQDDGTYIFSIEGVELVAGTVEYKVCVNYNWDECYGDPSSGNIDGNALLDIPENGMYNLTFTFDPSTNAVDATAELVNTGIGTIQSSKLNVQSNIYNLRGQRVNASTRGILIVNGKKVVVK